MKGEEKIKLGGESLFKEKKKKKPQVHTILQTITPPSMNNTVEVSNVNVRLKRWFSYEVNVASDNSSSDQSFTHLSPRWQVVIPGRKMYS